MTAELQPGERSAGEAALILSAWVSPAFPIGGFAYSHGIEWAFEAGHVTNAATLHDWLIALLWHGAPVNDAILFLETRRALVARDTALLAELAELALALANSAERRLETVTQGNAFMLTIQSAWTNPGTAALRHAISGDIALPLSFAAAAEGHRLPLRQSLEAFLAGFVANLLSAAVRLGIIGQTDGQRLTAALIAPVAALAERSLPLTRDDLGGAAFLSDLAALQHETQYSRLFRS